MISLAPPCPKLIQASICEAQSSRGVCYHRFVARLSSSQGPSVLSNVQGADLFGPAPLHVGQAAVEMNGAPSLFFVPRQFHVVDF